MARLIPLKKVPLMGVFAFPTPSECEIFENNFCEKAGFLLPRNRKHVRGNYDRSLKGYFCHGLSKSFFRLIGGSSKVIYFPHDYYNE